MSQRRDPERERFWRDAVAAWKKSRQTIRAFCASRRLSEASLYAWRRELARRDRERFQRDPKLPPTIQKPSASAQKFVSLQVLRPAILEVVLPAGLVVRVPGGADAAAVATAAQLVAALRMASC